MQVRLWCCSYRNIQLQLRVADLSRLGAALKDVRKVLSPRVAAALALIIVYFHPDSTDFEDACGLIGRVFFNRQVRYMTAQVTQTMPLAKA